MLYGAYFRHQSFKFQIMTLRIKLASILAIVIFCACGENSQEAVADSKIDSTTKQTAENINQPDTVNKPRLVTEMPDGSYVLTAENGRGVGPEIKYMPEWRAFGWFTAADHIEWDTDIKTAGEYEVHLDWSVSDEEAGKEFLLQAKDQTLTGTVAKSGSWETFKTENVGRIKLDAGRQLIILKSKTKFDKGALFDLRSVKLIPVR